MVDRKKCVTQKVWNDINDIQRRIVIDEFGDGCIAVHKHDERAFKSGGFYRTIKWHHNEGIIFRENHCMAKFECNHCSTEPCVYFKESEDLGCPLCKFASIDGKAVLCNSYVAILNRVTILQKEILK